MKYFLSVDEPWNFIGPNGNNIIDGFFEIISDKTAIFISDKEIQFETVKGKIFVLHPRYEKQLFPLLRTESSLVVGGGLLLDQLGYKNLSETELDNNAVYVFIGSVERSK